MFLFFLPSLFLIIVLSLLLDLLWSFFISSLFSSYYINIESQFSVMAFFILAMFLFLLFFLPYFFLATSWLPLFFFHISSLFSSYYINIESSFSIDHPPLQVAPFSFLLKYSQYNISIFLLFLFPSSIFLAQIFWFLLKNSWNPCDIVTLFCGDMIDLTYIHDRRWHSSIFMHHYSSVSKDSLIHTFPTLNIQQFYFILEVHLFFMPYFF